MYEEAAENLERAEREFELMTQLLNAPDDKGAPVPPPYSNAAPKPHAARDSYFDEYYYDAPGAPAVPPAAPSAHAVPKGKKTSYAPPGKKGKKTSFAPMGKKTSYAAHPGKKNGYSNSFGGATAKAPVPAPGYDPSKPHASRMLPGKGKKYQ